MHQHQHLVVGLHWRDVCEVGHVCARRGDTCSVVYQQTRLRTFAHHERAITSGEQLCRVIDRLSAREHALSPREVLELLEVLEVQAALSGHHVILNR